MALCVAGITIHIGERIPVNIVHTIMRSPDTYIQADGDELSRCRHIIGREVGSRFGGSGPVVLIPNPWASLIVLNWR